MKLTPEVEKQVTTLLRFQTISRWGVGIASVTFIIIVLSVISYIETSPTFVMSMIFAFVGILVLNEFLQYRLWLRFIHHPTARRLLTVRFSAFFFGFIGIGIYSYPMFQETSEPQTLQAFLLSQLALFGASLLGKRLDRVVKHFDDRYLTRHDLNEIREARAYEAERQHGET